MMSEKRVAPLFLVCFIAALMLSGCSESLKSKPTKRVGMVVGLRSEMLDEYKRMHANDHPGVRDLLNKYHLHNLVSFCIKSKASGMNSATMSTPATTLKATWPRWMLNHARLSGSSNVIPCSCLFRVRPPGLSWSRCTITGRAVPPGRPSTPAV